MEGEPSRHRVSSQVWQGGQPKIIPSAEIFLLTAATIQSKRRAYRFLASESLASAAAAGERRVVMRSPPMISIDLVVRAVSRRLSFTWAPRHRTCFADNHSKPAEA